MCLLRYTIYIYKSFQNTASWEHINDAKIITRKILLFICCGCNASKVKATFPLASIKMCGNVISMRIQSCTYYSNGNKKWVVKLSNEGPIFQGLKLCLPCKICPPLSLKCSACSSNPFSSATFTSSAPIFSAISDILRDFSSSKILVHTWSKSKL